MEDQHHTGILAAVFGTGKASVDQTGAGPRRVRAPRQAVTSYESKVNKHHQAKVNTAEGAATHFGRHKRSLMKDSDSLLG